MKCTNKIFSTLLCTLLVITTFCSCGKTDIPLSYGTLNNNPDYSIASEMDSRSLKLFAQDLAATDVDITSTSDISYESIYGAAVYDVNDKRVLYSYNATGRVNPASLTKMMTALTVIEKCSLDEVVTVPDVTINESGSQSFNLKEGDKITVENLLYVTLVYSGNDAALALAKYVSGTEEEFCNLMNERATQLGCTGTNFANSNGLTNESHYTTVYDLYLIFNEAMKHDIFKQIISTKETEVSYTTAAGEYVTKTVSNTNKYLNGGYSSPDVMTVYGGKTGSTNAAGKCLMVYGYDQFSNPYIAVIMGAADEDTLYKSMTQLIQQSLSNS